MKAYLKDHLVQSVFFAFIMLFCLQPVAAQSLAYAPMEKDEQKIKQLLTKYEALHKQSLAAYPVKHKKDYEEIERERWASIKILFEKGEIYTSAYAQSYLDALVNEIVNTNPVLKNQTFNCYFSRSGVPNAAYMGMGIIVFNMGLFQHIQNESQAAFILCHEIAHFYLKHSENSIEEYVTTLNSVEMQNELQKIKGAKYGKREQLDRLLKELTFDRRRHSRGHELEADSMAFELLKPTRFDAKEALNALAILDKIDSESFDTKSALQQIFNLPAYPFKKRWLAKEEGLLGGHAVLKEDLTIADSLKTHPDCSKRIAILTPKTLQLANKANTKNPADEAGFQKLRHESAYEVIAHAYNVKSLARSLYYTIILLQKNNEDPYLATQVGKILNDFYKAQREHQLSKLIDLPAPGFSPSYNQLLQFIQNLYMEDFAGLSFHYLQAFENRFKTYEPFAEAYRISQQNSQH